eukprot:g15990.t1
MRAACALVAGVCGMVATEAFVFNPAAASAACRTAPASSSSRRLQHTRMVRAAAVTDSADAAVVAEDDDNDDELEDGEEWVDSLWDGRSWPARTEDYNAMPDEARNWEVENERLPVWEDEPNPVEELTGKEWYDVFRPSDVEIDAAEFGFDWTDKWFEDNGMTRVDLPSEDEGAENK